MIFAISQTMEDHVVYEEEQLEIPFERHHEFMDRRKKEENNKPEMVNHPPHYKEGEIECIDYLEDSLGKTGFIFYLEGNIKKYMHRWRFKHQGNPDDLKKALWYMEKLISRVEE